MKEFEISKPKNYHNSENTKSISFKRKNKDVIGTNPNSKIRYFYIGKTDKIDIFKNNEIKSVKVKFQNNQTYLYY